MSLKLIRLKRHVRNHEGDTQARASLTRIESGKVSVRKKPKSRKWTRVTKEMAHTARLLGYYGDAVLKQWNSEHYIATAGLKIGGKAPAKAPVKDTSSKPKKSEKK